jgi:hypothetical protein
VSAVVIGPHGSGMTNVLLFEQFAVVELFEPRKVHPVYHAFAAAPDISCLSPGD